MQSISYDTAKKHKLIRFMSPGPFLSAQDAFYIQDGDRIRITSGDDGTVTSHTCQYIDPTHFKVGYAVFHMDQFSETMGKNRSNYEPETPITDLTFYETKYCDRTLKDINGKLIPYHEIIVQYDASHQPAFSVSICPGADTLRTVCITKRNADRFHQTFMSFPRLQECISGELYSILNRWDLRTLNAILHEQYIARQPSLSVRLQAAAMEMASQTYDQSAASFQSPSR